MQTAPIHWLVTLRWAPATSNAVAGHFSFFLALWCGSACLFVLADGCPRRGSGGQWVLRAGMMDLVTTSSSARARPMSGADCNPTVFFFFLFSDTRAAVFHSSCQGSVRVLLDLIAGAAAAAAAAAAAHQPRIGQTMGNHD